MTKASTIKKQIVDAQASLKALRADKPKIAELLAAHTAALTDAKRDGVDYGTLAQLQSKRDAFASVLAQHDEDIAALESRITDLDAKYDKQSAGERLAAAKTDHERLMAEYVGTVRQTLDTVEEALRAQLDKHGQVKARRKEITDLSIQLGIYQASPWTDNVRGTGFTRLYAPTLPGVFDGSYPELRNDRRVLEMLEQVAQLDEVAKTGDTRQVLAHREAKRQTQLREQTEARRAEALAAIERQDVERTGGVS